MYGAGITGENYLRGVQVTNHKGVVRFRSIYPACYSGRWPHIHFEVYRNVSEATGDGTPLVTSQLALPRTASMRVYSNVAGYEQSVTNLNRVSISSDMVFGDDGGVRELARMKGTLKKGLKARLVVPVDV
jgi:protocatechuate 3,4-dioxygenase beta subunit